MTRLPLPGHNKREHDKLLIVEGNDDKHSVIGLMRHHVIWPREPSGWPVWVEVGSSADEILAAAYLPTEIKASHVGIVGVGLDADVHVEGRYQRIQQLLSGLFDTFPDVMPPDGLTIENSDRKRFGLWLMPDNRTVGDLETFLHYLVPSDEGEIWRLACESVANAKSMGAKCRDPHIAKANLYTWLAWQEPPGQSPGLALTKRILDPDSAHADAFIKWFKRLYRFT